MTTQSKLRKEIFNNAHLSSIKSSAREYFKQSGIDFSYLTMNDFDKLREFIQTEIKKIKNLTDDPTYRMISELKVKEKIKREKHGIRLRVAGSYFDDREGISFWTQPLEIGFCAGLVGCNQIPFIVGFVNWVDYLREVSNDK